MKQILNDELPRISCVMPTYGRPAYVDEAAWMFLQQDYPNKELVILNDCPGQTYICDLPEGAGVRVINAPERFATLGAKRNACIEEAQGELIAVWDDDDVYLPWRLSYSVTQMQAGEMAFFRGRDFWAYWGSGELHHNQSVPGWAGHPNTLFTKALWRSVEGYPSVDIGEDSTFYDRVERALGDSACSRPIPPEDRFFIMRGKSQYPHLSIAGGTGSPDTKPREIVIRPRPIADPILRANYRRLVRSRSEDNAGLPQRQPQSDHTTSPPVLANSPPDLSVCISLKNRSCVLHDGGFLPLFPNCVESLVEAAQATGLEVELVVADFGSNDARLEDWIDDLAGDLQVRVVPVEGGFSRGKGLNHAVAQARASRLLLSDADVLIDADALTRAIELIDQGKAWFPVFRCYDVQDSPAFWLDDGYGIAGMHRRLYDISEGVPEFESWGGEDNVFFSCVSKHTSVVRERWSGLRHQWHPESCRHTNYAYPARADYDSKFRRAAPNRPAATGGSAYLPQCSELEVEERVARCKACSQFAGLMGGDARCRATPSGRTSLRTGRCRLRKWPSARQGSGTALRDDRALNNDNAHFVWLGGDLPPEHAAELARFMVLNPNLRVRLWNDIPETMPSDLKDVFYNAAPLFCQKSDIIRVWVLLEYGGMYFDTDIAWISSIEHLRNKPGLWATGTHMDVSGFAMGARPANPLLTAYRQLIVEKAKLGAYRHRQCYGPDCLAELANKGMEVLPRSCFDAVSSHEQRLAIWQARPADRRAMIEQSMDCPDNQNILGLHAGLDSRRSSDEPDATH